jgi:NAD(P)-dependent dehydrogenase (short-subunit alcohol dehydrogenase family)
MISYDIKGKNCIITGANSGIGKELSIELGKRGANLLLICRDLDKGLIAQKEIIKESGNNNVELFIFDLSIIESIKDGISTIHKKYKHIDILINNAGVLLFKKEITCEGYEKTLATNYIGPYTITNQVLKINNPQKKCKIINVVSEGVGEDSFDLLMLEDKKKYNGIKAYSFSKQALIYFTYEMAKRLKNSNTSINCFYPGLVQTNLGKPEKGFFRFTFNIMSHLLKSKFISIEDSIKPCLFLLCSKKGNTMSGYYLKRENDKVKAIRSFDEVNSEKLWNKTLSIVK